MSVRIIGPQELRWPQEDPGVINTTSRSVTWSKGLSPFFLGPIEMYDLRFARVMENAWQYCKVYEEHVDEDGNPTQAYWTWAEAGWKNPKAVRYPMGKNRIPLYSLWDGQQLTYVNARRIIYCPLYSYAVEMTPAWKRLKAIHDQGGEITLWDFDGYDHVARGMCYNDVLTCTERKMGHAFVLGMMLEDERFWEVPTDGHETTGA